MLRALSRDTRCGKRLCSEAATLAVTLEEAMQTIEVDPARTTVEPIDIVDVDLVGLAAAVMRWKHSRN